MSKLSESRDGALSLSRTVHNGPLSGTTRVGRYQKRKTNLDFTEARDSEWQWQSHCAYVVCYFRDVYPFIYFIIAMYVHHLGLYCILFRRFLISKSMYM